MSGAARLLPCTVAHVADFYRRYPGEDVTFFTRVQAQADLPNYTLQIILPVGMEAGRIQPPPRLDGLAPRYLHDNGATAMLWTVPGGLLVGARDEFAVTGTVGPAEQDCILPSSATVTVEPEDTWPGHATESTGIAVFAKGRWLRHLPAIYEEDELMGRFLMLFESFWAPIEMQIDNLWRYFDPMLTPPAMLNWLASWLNLALDEQWTEEQRRQLVRRAAALYRRRGTRGALLEYLELYTGVTPQIVEHRANDFRLGSDARLGSGLAVGRGNVPNTFSVKMRPPAVQGATPAERERLDNERRRKIEAIIEAEKPAHARYALSLENEDDD